MTNRNIIVSDSKSGVTVAIAVPTSTVFPHRYFSSKKLIKKLEACGNGGATFSVMLDSMRTSSPTRKAASDANYDHTSWTLQHPSALSMLEEIRSVSIGKQIVVFLDYDGTLSPIVDDPDRAFMTPEMREAVRRVAKFFPTAIVSGRSRSKVHSFVGLSELYYAGSHGMDIKGPTKGQTEAKENQTVLCQPAREFLPMIDELQKVLVEKTKHIPGAKIENNKFCLSVHYRCVEEERWGELGYRVTSLLKGYQKLRMTQGRKVLEIRPAIKWDKGNALEFLLESLGYAESNDVFPVYIGDDRTDEDAFKVLRKKGQGVGILVSKVPRETSASYSLKEPSEVMQFLTGLVEWKK